MNSIFLNQIRLKIPKFQIKYFCDICYRQNKSKFRPKENPDHKKILCNVKGLSAAVLKECECHCEVKPGVWKQGEYKNPEYLLYNKWSFYEANSELEGFRMEQPSALEKKSRKL